MSNETAKPPDTQAYEAALALLRGGRVDEGIEALLGLVPRMPKVLGDLVWAYHARGISAPAYTYLKQYLEHFPEDYYAWSLMTQVARECNNLTAAEQAARRAVALQPKEARFWYELGEVLFFTSRWKEAARAYAKCLKLDPQFSKAQVRRQLALRLVGLGPIHRLVRWKPIRSLLRMFLSSGLVSDLIELDMGIALHDRRWQMPLAWEGAVGFAKPAPPDQSAAQFAAHFDRCPCPWWQWFRAIRLEGRVEKLLEVGHGPGHVAHHFAAAGFAPKSLVPDDGSRRDREQRGIAAVCGDMHFVGGRGGSFDLLLAHHALQQSRAPLFALWEWRRVLRPDGYLLLMAHLPVDRPASVVDSPRATGEPALLGHLTYGVAGQVMTLTYWQLRRLFKLVGFQLIAETLQDPADGQLAGVEHVDGRRPRDLARAWDFLVLLRKPGRLSYDGEMEKPRGMPAPKKPSPS